MIYFLHYAFNLLNVSKRQFNGKFPCDNLPHTALWYWGMLSHYELYLFFRVSNSEKVSIETVKKYVHRDTGLKKTINWSK